MTPLYLFAGGGSGGHLFPGLALAEELRTRRPDARVLFATSGKAIDRRVLDRGLLDGAAVEVVTMPGESPATLKRSPWRFLTGAVAAWRAAGTLLETRRPSVVIGLGGFASAALVRRAAGRRIPIVLLEQNAVAGRATRWLSRWADVVCLTFDESIASMPRAARARCVVTGNPLRASIAALADLERYPPVQSHSAQPTDASEPPTLLILGGSQGARGVNDAMLAAAASLVEAMRGWRVVHQTGAEQVDAVARQYDALGLQADVAAFFDDMPARYQTAALVVARAGATTLTELACAGLPSLLVPYPRAADDHQTANAMIFARAGAAVVVPQVEPAQSTADSLARELAPLLASPERRLAMSRAARSLAKPTAASAAADIVERVLSVR